MLPKDTLLRIVRISQKALIDTSGKAQGRGSYLCKTHECLSKARKRRGLERSYRGSASVELGLYDDMEALIQGLGRRFD